MSTEVARTDANLPDAVQPEARSLLEVIASAVADPRMDVSKMERLLAMHKEIMADQRKEAFTAAMARLQARLPQIQKDGRIVVKNVERSRYAKYEDIDVAVRPLCAEEGFALDFGTTSTDGKLFTITCEITHKDGYSKTHSLMLPMDKSDFRSDVQSIGSTLSYARRQLTKMALNIVEKDEDDDANGGAKPISEEQARDIETVLADVKGNKDGFLNFMGVESIREIRARDYQKAINALETKRKASR
jgi:hypothetical protein